MKLPSGDEIPHLDEQVTCVVGYGLHAMMTSWPTAHQIPYLVIGNVRGFVVHNDRALIHVRQLGINGPLLEYRLDEEGVSWTRGWHYPRSAEGKALLVSFELGRS